MRHLIQLMTVICLSSTVVLLALVHDLCFRNIDTPVLSGSPSKTKVLQGRGIP